MLIRVPEDKFREYVEYRRKVWEIHLRNLEDAYLKVGRTRSDVMEEMEELLDRLRDLLWELRQFPLPGEAAGRREAQAGGWERRQGR